MEITKNIKMITINIAVNDYDPIDAVKHELELTTNSEMALDILEYIVNKFEPEN